MFTWKWVTYVNWNKKAYEAFWPSLCNNTFVLKHIDEKLNKIILGQLRRAFFDTLVALHLESYANTV